MLSRIAILKMIYFPKTKKNKKTDDEEEGFTLYTSFIKKINMQIEVNIFMRIFNY